jgi:hypothetical protein
VALLWLATREEYGGNEYFFYILKIIKSLFCLFFSLYKFYPSRIPVINSTDYINYNLIENSDYSIGGLGRTAGKKIKMNIH